MKLVVATRSAHKMVEIRRILADVPHLEVLDLDEAGVAYDPVEEGLEPHDTFEANALSKAEHFHRLTGLATVADDSGLAVDALDGAPGVRSKRFAPTEGIADDQRDEANNRHLLSALEGTPDQERGARFVCVAVLVGASAAARTFRGEAPGRILHAARGQGGFGYDPLFYDSGLGRTFAELTSQEKNARSHRGAAFRALAEALREETHHG